MNGKNGLKELSTMSDTLAWTHWYAMLYNTILKDSLKKRIIKDLEISENWGEIEGE